MKKSDVLAYFGGVVLTAAAVNRTKGAVSQWPEELPLRLQFEIEGRTGGELLTDRVAAEHEAGALSETQERIWDSPDDLKLRKLAAETAQAEQRLRQSNSSKETFESLSSLSQEHACLALAHYLREQGASLESKFARGNAENAAQVIRAGFAELEGVDAKKGESN